jgi:hypothetical protein
MTSFEVTWDYRCPFARIAHDHILLGLEAGADWDVTFRAFSLDQTHVEEGQPPVWDEPDRYPGLLANLAGVVVRDRMPDEFPRAHRALFEARHVHALDLRDRSVVTKALADAGVDSEAVLAEVDSGWPLRTLAEEHSDAAERLHVFGVPTFIIGSSAVFVRLMKGPEGDAQLAVSTISRLLDLMTGWPDLNEFKHSSLSN